MELISREQAIATIDSFNVFESRYDQIKLELMIRELPPAQSEISMEQIKIWLDKWEGYIDKDIIERMKYRVIDIPLVNVKEVTE